jgi:dihydroflavonol-4-reductase
MNKFFQLCKLNHYTSAMKVLVSGANGLLGHHVVNLLLLQNEEVRIIVRSPGKLYFDRSEVEILQGDFTNKDTATSAVRGCDAVIHIAGATATHLSRNEYFRINSEATSTLLAACESLHVKRFVYVSTTNTIGHGTYYNPADENTALCYPFNNSWYAQSKKQAELEVEKFAANKDNRVIILHPSFMIGAMDTRPGSGRLLLMGYKKRWMFVPRGGKNFVPAQKVAIACCKSLYEGKTGDHYLITGENLSFTSFYERMKRVGGYPRKITELPDLLLLVVAKAGDVLRWLGVPTELCTRNISQLIVREYYSGQKADQAFQLPVLSLDESIEETLKWFESNGYLKQ